MSMRLNLVDSLFDKSQRLHKLGRAVDTEQILRNLSEFRKLPGEVAEMSQATLAEIYLKQKRYRKARRALTAALSHRPDCARYHYLMAQAWRNDDKGDDEKAIEHYERSLELDPEQPQCLSELGLLRVEIGLVEEGLDALRRAVDMVPDDTVLLERLTTGLRLANRSEEARKALLAARFRNPRDARFRKLWTDFQFQELRRQQEMEKLNDGVGIAEDEPMILEFKPQAGNESKPRQPIGKILRRDPPAPASPPHEPRLNLPRQCS